MKIVGRAFKFGDDIDTDVIIPAQYLNSSDPAELALHCLEGIAPDFASGVRPGDIIIAGKNFGCGSSREHAPLAIKHAGISCVIAVSFARIFYRNSFNIGLPLLECPEAWATFAEGVVLEIDLTSGEIREQASGRSVQARPIPPFMLELIADGGLMRHVARAAGLPDRQGSDV